MQILNLIRSRFRDALQNLVADVDPHLQRVAMARDPKHGDYQANFVMGLSKQLGMSEDALAQTIVDKLEWHDFCESVEVAGRGFINLRLSSAWIAERLIKLLQNERCDVSLVEQAKTFVIDYSSPNVAKPLHVGHIRSTVIGDALVRMLRFVGHKVVSDNHLGDWGTQFGMVIYGYKHFVNREAYVQKPVDELGRMYRLVRSIMDYQATLEQLPRLEKAFENQQKRLAELQTATVPSEGSPEYKKFQKQVTTLRNQLQAAAAALVSARETIASPEKDAWLAEAAREHPSIEKRVLQETVLLHEGDSTNVDLWKEFLPHCLAEIHHIYRRLGVQFDLELGESFYHDRLASVVEDLLRRGLAIESDGAVCVFLEEYDAPMIIRKKDGAFLYATTDLATIFYRLENFNPDSILYVVDHRQHEHFAKLFATARKIGITDVELRHIGFGTVLGTDGKPFKTRSGSVVGLEYLLDEAIERAWQVVCNPDRLKSQELALSEEEMKHIAQVVGIGAIKYADLAHNRTSDYVFDLDKMVRLDGNTAAYIQYSYARTSGILRKAGIELLNLRNQFTEIQLVHPAERALASQIIRFDETLHQSLVDYLPSAIADYLYDLAKLFASFFDQCSVLRAETEISRSTRLALVAATRAVLRQGLGLLGIEVVEKM